MDNISQFTDLEELRRIFETCLSCLEKGNFQKCRMRLTVEYETFRRSCVEFDFADMQQLRKIRLFIYAAAAKYRKFEGEHELLRI